MNEVNYVNEIRVINEGEHAGHLKLKIAKSPFVSHDIIACPRDVYSMVALGADDLGADDTERSLIAVDKYISAASGVEHGSDEFVLEADAFRDKPMLEWILSKKDAHEETFGDFNDLMLSRFNERVQHGGLNMIAAYEARATGFASL